MSKRFLRPFPFLVHARLHAPQAQRNGVEISFVFNRRREELRKMRLVAESTITSFETFLAFACKLAAH
jgi:hypothetical protein